MKQEQSQARQGIDVNKNYCHLYLNIREVGIYWKPYSKLETLRIFQNTAVVSI